MTLRCNDRLCTRERGAGLGSTAPGDTNEGERERGRESRKKGKRKKEKARQARQMDTGTDEASLSSILQELKGRLRATATPAIKKTGAD